jgi:hypothetical protein
MADMADESRKQPLCSVDRSRSRGWYRDKVEEQVEAKRDSGINRTYHYHHILHCPVFPEANAVTCKGLLERVRAGYYHAGGWDETKSLPIASRAQRRIGLESRMQWVDK